MFFLMRCMFWLGLVFYFMPWSSREAFDDLGGRAALSALIHASGAAISDYCLSSPRQCADMAQASAPVQTSAPIIAGPAEAPLGLRKDAHILNHSQTSQAHH
jgi:hypothetical protein